MRNVLGGIRPRRADQDAAGVPRPLEVGLIENDIIPARDHRVIVSELDQVGIAVHDAQHFNAVPAERGRGRRDHRIGRRRRSAGEQDCHPLNFTGV